ncbi:MAG: carboxypeptidase regulatory-like domain-containing protein [Gemmatimonadota bacterium]
MKPGLSLAWVVASLGCTAPAASQFATVSGTVDASDVRSVGAVVYLLPEAEAANPSARDTPVIDQANLRFVPPVLAVLPGTAVEFRNSDPILHNVFSPKDPGVGFNLGTYPRHESRLHLFREVGAHVILCHVHPEMVAWVVVVDTPYRAVADGEGRFRIDNVPAGRYAVNVWHQATRPFRRDIVVHEGESLHLTLRLPRSGR